MIDSAAGSEYPTGFPRHRRTAAQLCRGRVCRWLPVNAADLCCDAVSPETRVVNKKNSAAVCDILDFTNFIS